MREGRGRHRARQARQEGDLRGRRNLIRRGRRHHGDDDDEAQLAQYWRDLDRRVSNRRPRAVGPGTPTGRGPRRRSEVDYWLQAGLCADISHGGAAISSS
mmetsp:Transcript_3795/g.14986  ORF Transcript_3795/g.14986 Transcript_3795/m.14986 type:complete len:100 (+) Transcript_3795:1332-1631(+)